MRSNDIDLLQQIGYRKLSTSLIQHDGHALQHLGIFDGDYLIVELGRSPRTGQIVSAQIDGETVIRQLGPLTRTGFSFTASPGGHHRIQVPRTADITVQGVVSYALHPLHPGRTPRHTITDETELRDLLRLNHPASYILRAQGNTMRAAGIFDGDEVVVNRGLNATNGHLVVAVVGQKLSLKRLQVQPNGLVQLCTENPHRPVLTLPTLSALRVWGIPTWSVRHVAHA